MFFRKTVKQHRQKRGSMILTMINNKGGTGKTTSAINVAAALSLNHGQRTLLVDLDSQASTSLAMGIERVELSPSIADVLLEGRPWSQVIRDTSTPKLHLVSASSDLANADLILADISGRERCLSETLRLISPDYDYIILDCPPSMSLLSINAMVSSDAYIIPTPAEYLAMEGLIGMMEAVQKIQRGIQCSCYLMGILLTMVDRRRRITKEVTEVIRAHYQDQVFKTEIRIDVRLVEAPSFGQAIFEYARHSSGAQCYAELTKEIIERSKEGDQNGK